MQCKHCPARLHQISYPDQYKCHQCGIVYTTTEKVDPLYGWFWMSYCGIEWHVRIGYGGDTLTAFRRSEDGEERLGTTILCDDVSALSLDVIHNKIKTYLTFS